MKQKPSESETNEFPKPPQVREYGFRSQCHGAECISVPFYAEDNTGKLLGKVCDVIQCHHYGPKIVSSGEEGLDETRTVACLKVQGVVRSRRDRYFGISVKSILALAEKGTFGAHIKTVNTREQPKVGIERAFPDEF